MGSFNVFIVISTSYFTMHNLTVDETSIISIFSYSAGIVGSIVFSYLADRFKNYKFMIIILTSCLLFIQVIMTVLMEIFKSPDFYFYLVLICYTAFGLMMIPIISIGIDFLIESTFPIGESISFGMLISFSRIIGLITVRLK